MRSKATAVLMGILSVFIFSAHVLAVDIDISNSTMTITGPTTFRLEGVSAMQGKYWGNFTWNSSQNVFQVADYGEMANGNFDVTERQFIDSFTANCDGNIVATIDLGAAPNALNVEMTLVVNGDKDVVVLQPDGVCHHIGTCGDAMTAGQKECVNIVNGPQGVYTVMTHSHSTADNVDFHIYGQNGIVNLTPVAVQKIDATKCTVNNLDESK